jgi:hypothetical protein
MRRSALVFVVLFAAANTASAQAWVAPKGVGAVNLVFQDVDHTGHLLADGSLLAGYDSATQGILLEFDYAFTDRISISVGVPYIRSKYIGPEASFFGLELDDCHCWNSDWQDLGLTARYNVANGDFAFTPFVGFGFPTHDYPFVGEATVGRNLWERRLGFDIGQRLSGISPRLSIFGRYSYAWVEEVLGIDTNRSDIRANIGYGFSRRFSGTLDFYWVRTHGGLTSNEFVTDELFYQFDRLLKDISFHWGASVTYSFSHLDVFASYIKFESGRDTHTGNALTLGVSWPFQL